MDMNDNKRRRSMLLYILIAIVAYLAISQALGSGLTAQRVQEVGYSQFVDMVEKNEVTAAQTTVGSSEITFTSSRSSTTTTAGRTILLPFLMARPAPR